MAELDLLSPEGFVEDARGPLILRTAAIEPPAHPLGPDYAQPHWAVFASAKHHDQGWVCLFSTTVDPEQSIATLDQESLERTERLSILLGAAWVNVVDSAKTVRDVQEAALKLLPPDVYQAPVEQLRAFRAAIWQADPSAVATIATMTFYWANDTGGDFGPRHVG